MMGLSSYYEVCFSEHLDNFNSPDKTSILKMKIVKRVNHSRFLKSVEGRSRRKKKKRLKHLSLLYDVHIPKGRPSKKLLKDSSISDSEFAKRNMQFLRDHGKGTDCISFSLGEVSEPATSGADKHDDPTPEPLYAHSVEEEAVLALDYGRRLGLVPIIDEETTLEGLKGTISRRRSEWLALQHT